MHHIRPLCGKCAYWMEDHTASPATAGHCHRYPPAVAINPQTGVVLQKFPTTDRNQWCGEWTGSDERLMQAMRAAALEAAERQPR